MGLTTATETTPVFERSRTATTIEWLETIATEEGPTQRTDDEEGTTKKKKGRGRRRDDEEGPRTTKPDDDKA